MKKKYLIILLTLVISCALMTPVLAAGAGPAASAVKLGNDVFVTVREGAVVVAEGTGTYVKNGAEDIKCPLVAGIGEYVVNVTYNGSGVNKVTIKSVPAETTTNNGNNNNNGNNGNEKINNNYDGLVKQDFNNAQFHCNTFGGNGRVWPIIPADMKKFDGSLTFGKISGTTKWLLDSVADKKGNALTMVVCPVCGSTQWITFSNNSGVPDGKNIQMQHPLIDIEIVKIWLDAEGNLVKDAKGLTAKFEITYTIGSLTGKTIVGPGKIGVPAGTYIIKELPIANHKLIGISGLNMDITTTDCTITVSEEEALAGGKKSCAFTNKEDPHALIIKEWNIDGQIIVGGYYDGVTAYFDLYALGECDEECAADCDIIHRGALIKEGLRANEKYYISPGVYVVAEQAKTGYIAQPDQLIEVGENKIGKCVFVNEPDIPVILEGSLSFVKKIEDMDIVSWLAEKGLSTNILNGLEFYLEGVGVDGNTYSYGPASPDHFTGVVALGGIYPGIYTLSEKITGAAIGIFKKMADIEDIMIGEGPGNHFVLGGTINGNIEGPDIVAGDHFKVYNGYGDFRWGYDDSGIGYPGLNASGHIFYIGVTNIRTGETIDSYCANGGSTAFGAGDYLIAHSLIEKDWIMAFNYIYDVYGDLNENRVITQVVTWALLGAVDVNSQAFEDTKLKAEEKAAIKDVMENYGGYVGSGKVIDVLFMTDVNTPYINGQPDYSSCQPQIVPVFGTFYVENEPEDGDFFSGVSFTKTKFGGLVGVDVDEFAFTLYQIIEGKEIKINNPDADTYPDGNFYTGYFGVVTTGNILAPGSYVFREVPKTYAVAGADYKLIWKADDLYFDINEKGEAIWKNTNQNNPTLDNTFWNKSVMQWVAEIQTGAGTMGEPLDNGYIFYPGGKGGDAVIFEVTYPNCTQGGVIWFFYSNEDGTKGQPLMSIGFAEPLGHNWELNTFADGLRCATCGLDIGWWDLSAELYDLYKALGGTGTWIEEIDD